MSVGGIKFIGAEKIKLYHHHIPRTGGTYLISSLDKYDMLKSGTINPFMHGPECGGDSYSISKLDVESHNFISGHFAAEPYKIDKEIKSFTTLRNPIKRLVSQFAMILGNGFPGKALYEFEEWVFSGDDMESKSNFQSKFLVNGLTDHIKGLKPEFRHLEGADIEQINKVRQSGWGIDGASVSYEDAKSVLNQMILVGKTENMNEFTLSLADIMYDAYGIERKDMSFSGSERNSEILSQYIYDNLNTHTLAKLEDLNSIDFQLWEEAK
jgi:hypothetical protein